ncbi:redoxin domain-containing protein [Chloroflexi bacterium TSY]|nr:redoxin domain-containing protein [Chloroflexi bacterium TSY]
MPRYAEFAALNTKIVAISFGNDYWARAWLEETQSPFPIWLDQGRRSYQAYGLERSVLRAWGFRNLFFYAKALLRGEKLQENRGDTDQMGGNFIIDSNGIIRFAYPSRDPTDRPDIQEMLGVLEAVEDNILNDSRFGSNQYLRRNLHHSRF